MIQVTVIPAMAGIQFPVRRNDDTGFSK